MPVGENQRLAALYERRILDTPPEERFDRVTRLARRLFDVDEALVNLIDRDRQWTKSTSLGPQGSGNEVRRTDSFCHTTVAVGDYVLVEDATLDERFRHNPHVTGSDHVRFYAGCPLAAPGGEPVGTLCLVDSKPRQLTDIDREALRDLLRDLAGWVEKELNLDSELDRAGQVQQALLPALPPVDAEWDVTGGCRPSRDVGGDFYDWHQIGGDTAILLADVMGKGMPAAIVAATARAALRAGADPSPAVTIERAAAPLPADLTATSTFVTVFAATLGRGGRIVYADAGHGHAGILRADGTVLALARGGAPIGLGVELDDTPQEYHEVLEPGDLLVAHSDGLIELPDGPRSTSELLAHLRGADASADVLTRIARLIGNVTPPDDLTALVVRRPSAKGS